LNKLTEKLESGYCGFTDRFLDFFRDKRILFCITVTFLWGLAAHGYGFMNMGFSHDGLNVIYAGAQEEVWKTQLGRFFVPAYRALTRGPVALPWLIGLISLTFLSGAVFLAIDLFDVKTKPLMVIISGVLVTNISLIAQGATYLYETDFNCLAFLFAIAAAWLWRKKKGLLPSVAASLLVMLSIGIYQAFFAITVTLIIMVSLLDLFRGRETKEVFFNGIRGIFILLAGGILYFISGKVIYAVTGIAGEGRTDVFNFSGMENPILFYLRLVIRTYYDFIDRLHHPAYPGSIQTVITVMEALMILCLVWALVRMKKKEWLRYLLIAALLGVLPFAMNVTYFLARGSDVHDLMIYAVWLVWIFFPLFVSQVCMNNDNVQPMRCTPLRHVSLILVMVLLLNNVLLANSVYNKKHVEAQSTLSTMTRVLSLIEQHEDYIYKETPVAFMGTTNAYGDLPGYEHARQIIGVRDSMSINTDYSLDLVNLFESYFRNILNYPLVFCDNHTHYALRTSQEVADMPAFPEKGCIQMINGVLVVKMGYNSYLDPQE